jgi:hypothetical protein
MARVTPKQSRFSRGQISKKLHGSQDLELYYAALELCRNYIVDGRGMLERRPGTLLRWRTKSDGPAVLFGFAFDDVTAYVLEMGAGYLRAGFDGGLVLDGLSPFETTHPFTVAQLQEASTHQLGDIMWMAHRDVPLQVIRRTAVDEFDVETFDLRDGPYLDEDTQGVRLTFSGTGLATPDMTGPSAPSGLAGSSDPGAEAWKAFNRERDNVLVEAATPDINYSFGGPTKVVDAYFLRAPTGNPISMPVSWVVEGFDGTNYIALDSRSGETGWFSGETRVYSMPNETAYTNYRITFRAREDDVTTAYVLDEIGYHERAESAPAITVTASGIGPINSGQGFLTTDVGRSIRILGSDNFWRWARIVSRISATQITVKIYGQALPDTSPITRWRLGALYQGNHPACVTIHENRLALAVNDRVFLSQPDDYDNFSPTEPDSRVLPASAINERIPAFNAKRGARARIQTMKSNDYQLVIGTTAGMATLQSNSFGEGITSENVTIRPQDGRGFGRMDADVIGDSVLGIDNTRQRVMGTFPRDGSGRLGAQDLSLPADDITSKGITFTTLQDYPHSILWTGLEDGTLGGLTIQPEEQVQGWHEHVLGGRFIDNGRRLPAQVESSCAVPGRGGTRDLAYFLVKRTIGGVTRRFVEEMQDFWTVGQGPLDQYFVDGGLRYEGNEDETATLSIVSGSGPTTVRSINTTNCPAFTAGQALAIHDGVRWHRGRIQTVDGSNDITWLPDSPNAYPREPDGFRWYYVDSEWTQLEEGDHYDVYANIYEDLAQTTSIWRWSLGIETLTGLDDYEGERIDLLVDGYPIMGQLVTDGEITGLPEGCVIAAGFHSPCKGRLLPIEAGSQNGSAQNKQRQVYGVDFDLLESGPIEVGTGMPSEVDGRAEHYAPLELTQIDNPLPGVALPLTTKYVRASRDEQGSPENPRVAWQVSTPVMSFIRGIITRLSTSDGR